MEQSNSKACWQFTFNGLIALFLEVLNLFQVLSFEHQILGLYLLALIVQIYLILTITKHRVIKPTKASYLAFVVKELKFDWIRELSKHI